LTTSRAALVFVLLTVFIDSLGWGIIIPSMAPVIMELTHQPEAVAVTWNGYLMAVFALLQFFTAPIFDTRKPSRKKRDPSSTGSQNTSATGAAMLASCQTNANAMKWNLRQVPSRRRSSALGICDPQDLKPDDQ